MLRSFPSNKGSKGQWFIISAIIVSGAFLAISGLFKGYYDIDTSVIGRYNEDYYFKNIKTQFNVVVQDSDCTDMQENLDEFVYFSEQSMQERGYFLFVNYTINNCLTKDVSLGMLLASERAVIYENVNPEDIIEGYE